MNSGKIIFIDTETGGLDPLEHSLLSLALVVWEDLMIIDSVEILINDGELNVTKEAIDINKIDIHEHAKVAVLPPEALERLNTFIEKHISPENKVILAGHNINFDINFLKQFMSKNGQSFSQIFSHRFIDTASILYFLHLSGKVPKRVVSSQEAFDYFNIQVKGRHSALGDALATAELFTKLLCANK